MKHYRYVYNIGEQGGSARRGYAVAAERSSDIMTKKELIKILSAFKDDEEIIVSVKWSKTSNYYYTDACIKRVVYTMEDGCLNTIINFVETIRKHMAA